MLDTLKSFFESVKDFLLSHYPGIVFGILFLVVLRILIRLFVTYKEETITLPSGDQKIVIRKTKTFEWLSNIFGFWKKYLPAEFRLFLEKYDTITKENNSEDDDIITPYPRLMLGIYFLIIIVIFFAILRYCFFWIPEAFGGHESRMRVLTEHIDVAGLINGILGLLAAIMIARIVEAENKKNKDKVEKTTQNIQTATDKIEILTGKLSTSVSDIIANFTALKPSIDP
ncbi:hypothetical protein IC229_23725 [Spirosoma sp. BT702]|uniref:Uncharacterized protein n=1 Tax=Spirosoma profusum TaxID=2771354 RepID=A0A926Y0I7_9BACT|nr:hypothetical protein [Spirosoma profusum]MBD2703675.1 hypothetical protein [Spirosoma profusum]